MFTANNLHNFFDNLAENSWTLIPIDLEFAHQLLKSAKSKSDSFRKATTTHSDQPVSQIRSDQIFWLDEKDATLNETDQLLLKQLDAFKSELQNYFRVSLNEFECHYSVYQAGQRYVRHRDITQTNNRRIFSFVIYLNEVWSDSDGGQIVGYHDDQELFRVNPLIGQMILFKSDLEHEVTEAHKTRFALTGWLRK